MLFYICISSLPVPFSEILQHSLCHLAPDGCSHPQPVWQPGVSMHFRGKKSRQAENSFYPPTLWQLRVSVTQKGDDGAFSDCYSGQGSSSTLWKQAGPSLCLSGTSPASQITEVTAETWQHEASGLNFLFTVNIYFLESFKARIKYLCR